MKIIHLRNKFIPSLIILASFIMAGCFSDSSSSDPSPKIYSPLLDSTSLVDSLDVSTDFPMEIPFLEETGADIEFELEATPAGLSTSVVKREDTTFLKINLDKEKITTDSLYELSVDVKVPSANYTKNYIYQVVVIDTVVPDTFSVWYEITSKDSLKGTLLNHIPLNYEMVFGDFENSPISLSVDLLPKGLIANIDSSGDTLKLTVNWVKNDLLLNTDLELKLTFSGTGVNDIVRLSYLFKVLDQASLFHQITSSDTLKGTVVYDPAFSHKTLLLDTNQTPYQVRVDSISKGLKYTLDTLGDSVVLEINFDKDNMVFNSDLNVSVLVTGTGPDDTLRLNYPVVVTDPKTVWAEISSSDSLIDTVVYRDNFKFTLKSGDPHGFPIYISHGPLPSGFKSNVDSTGDTINFHITLDDTALVGDSTYNITVDVQGSGPEDTIRNNYSFHVKDHHSIWKHELSENPIPDTILYGDTVIYKLSFGDSSSHSIPDVTVTGLMDTSFYLVEKQGDTTSLTLTLIGSEHRYDSTHNIQIKVRGKGSADVTDLDYSFFAKDSSRLGGLKKMVKGIWWKLVQFDTISIFTDSAGVKSEESKTLTHELVTQVFAVRKDADTLYYTFYNSDSILELDSVEQQITFIKHTPTYAEMIFPVADFFLDSLSQKVLDLPVTVGDKWDISTTSFDTNFTVIVDSNVRLPLIISALLTGTSEVTEKMDYTTNGSTYPCSRMTNIVDNNFGMLYDSILINPEDSLDTLLTVGDSLSSALSHNEGDQCMSLDYLNVFWEHQLESTTETDVFKNIKVLTNSRKTKFMVEYFDPRIGTSIKFR